MSSSASLSLSGAHGGGNGPNINKIRISPILSIIIWNTALVPHVAYSGDITLFFGDWG